ncbi:CarboxypepD_reg-like domain-containing protein [Hymenobacter gelipurpurascens]|uniref:CarboxypepD_reg-like domain-containing protein n=1 Tax=Hymenobacter gelipurpurascens TaxID=89968 RepID=A0A212T026_9BACT|nr:carboxypeptidase-like regulatory domain-containing protein [Hymenobacter gelipurpurascens]SNC59388.1 CarboxypepD_reg-like domain-containing protein [Hymenobacter gelipurpurascens]
MRHFVVLGLLLWLLSFAAAAQQAVVVKGRVLDAQTHRPVPYALVGIRGNQLGTSANEEGRFSISIPPEYQPQALDITFIGYKRATVPLPVPVGQEVQVLLEPAPTQLANVTVSGSALGIVRAAVARIPRNYATRPVQLTGFYRESSNLPDGHYLYLAEGVLQVRKETYRTAHTSGDVQLQQTRKYEARDTSRTQLNWQAGPLIPHRFDFVYNRADFISKAHFAEYDYQIADVTTYNGRPVYAISFTPRSAKANYQGRMFINLDSYAFLGADFSLTLGGVRRYQAGFAAMGGYAYNRRARQVSYQRYAGRWYLKRVWDQAVSQQPGREYQHTSEFITTAIDTARSRRPAYADRFRPEEVFLRNSVAYDSTFWQNFTTLVLPKQVEQQLLDEERQRKAEQLFSDSTAVAAARPVTPDSVAAVPAAAPPPAPRRKGLLERLSYSSSLELVPVSVAAGGMQVAYRPAGSSFATTTTATVAPRRVSLLPRFDYLLWLTPDWQLHYGAGSLRGALRGGLQSAGLRYTHNLSERARPVYVRAGLDYSRITIRQRLGRFDNPDTGLRVAGTLLDADRLAIGLQSVTHALEPQLGLEIQLSSTLHLFAEASYRVQTAERNELLLEEKQGFFLTRTTARVPLSSPEVQVKLQDQARQTAPFQPRPVLVRVGLAVGGHR